jgi:integrase
MGRGLVRFAALLAYGQPPARVLRILLRPASADRRTTWDTRNLTRPSPNGARGTLHEKPGAKRGLKPQQVWAIRFYLDRERRVRDRALFDLAIDSKLRGCDVVKVRIGDLVSGARVRSRAMVIQQKTGRPVQFELLEPARTSILAWLEWRGGSLDDYAFPSRIDHAEHISTRQYARLVDDWVTGIGLRPEDYGTHSLRRTKASIIYKATGNLRAVQILLGHTKIESTVRYLGVDVEDALTLAEGTEV